MKWLAQKIALASLLIVAFLFLKQCYGYKETEGEIVYKSFDTGAGNLTRRTSADPASFIDLGNGYAKDAKQVFFEGKVVKFADPKTFKLEGSNCGYDNWNKFYQTMLVSYPQKSENDAKNSGVHFFSKTPPEADLETLTSLGNGLFLDQNFIYYAKSRTESKVKIENGKELLKQWCNLRYKGLELAKRAKLIGDWSAEIPYYWH